ncbi:MULTISPECIES: HEXXH motif domain-containing protein [Streptomyces]|uniref:HEXXH motif domain protein n=1 Tax=Streptomyces chartreusis NRRL 3882 TaxID=1079985 RepID=A0A2N9B541_STRCX|nr:MULTISPECIES: HEXXH motif domain-containing protein [Streptomyces]MYS90555.1 radical SAM protein [Streptomyces sp. SID5464]SOR78459.1 HEXXH motif domain protein [Streptomyces chartreusis NRRL 3882]
MPSAPRPAPFRMPERIFAELAAGGGSAEAVAFLERAERARRLLLLRTLLDRLGTLRTPLSPAAEAWAVLKEAAAVAPGPVDRLLLAPATGGWIAHVLRRLHGTASGPPLWAEAGHLCALALAASVRAGTRADLRVSLSDGGLPLPGLGLARLPGAERGFTVGRARTSGGELVLSGPGRDGGTVSVTVHPATQPLPSPAAEAPAPAAEAPGPGAWLPLRTLTHHTPAGPLAIPLEDLDPYRDLDDPLPPARLDDDEAEAWQRLFEEAVTLLAGPGGDGPGRFDPGAIRAVVPWGRTGTLPPAPPTVLVSASSGDSFGAMVIARTSSAVALAETLVHEFQHSKLAALLHLFPLLDDDREEQYYAPWRPDPRHLTGLLHGAYAFTGVTGFWRDRLAGARDDRAADTAGYHFALRRLQSRLVVRTLLASGRLTPQGRALVSGLAGTLDGWLREPVPHAALSRARTAAALHRTEWRLRNVDPAVEIPSDGPRFRPDRTSWPDVRTHAFADRPATPHTADEHLAAGDAAAALARYAGQLAADPAEPHALAGWIVARAVLEPGRATRRMLARPELLQPLPSG